MRVTQEADYAIRICCTLDEAGGYLDAESIAKEICVSKSTALKVLRALRENGLVSSRKGTVGGYALSRDPSELTVREIIEALDGRVCISKCLYDEHACSKNGHHKLCCKMHIAFSAINDSLVKSLSAITVRSITDPNVLPEQILKN